MRSGGRSGWPVRLGLVGGLVGMLVASAAGCSAGRPDDGGNDAHAAPGGAHLRLRLVDLPIVSGGDEHDQIGSSDDGHWWVIGRYPSNRVVLVDLRSAAVRRVPGLRNTGAAFDVTDAGRVFRDKGAATYPDLPLDRDAGGDRLFVVRREVHLSRPSARGRGSRSRVVATGFPRPGPELSAPANDGSLSAGARYVTIPTTRAYDPHDRNHAVDIYQLDLRSGRIRWVSRHQRPLAGVAASADGRFVVYAGLFPPSADDNNDNAVLRWDRRTGRTIPVSLASDGRPGRWGVSGDMAVSDDGTAAFVADDCNLTDARPPRGARACVYITPPAASAKEIRP